jgi:hypothetical protein
MTPAASKKASMLIVVKQNENTTEKERAHLPFVPWPSRTHQKSRFPEYSLMRKESEVNGT